MKYLRLYENPDNIMWYDSKFYYQTYDVYPIPFSICFKEEHSWRNVKGQDKKSWKDEDYAGVIIGPMVGGHSGNVFTNDNEMYNELRGKYGSNINYYNALNCRMWLKDKIISYWNDSQRKFFFRGLKDVEKILTQKIKDGTFNEFVGKRYNEDWEKQLTDVGVIKNGQFKIFNNRFKVDFEADKKMLPLSRFLSGAMPKKKVSKEEVKKQELLHLQSMAQKARMTARERIPGWKPKKYKYQLPGETEVQARARMTRYAFQEGMMNFNEYKLFESPEGITLVDDKNYLMPISSAYQDDARAFGYFEGQLKVDHFHSQLIPKRVRWEQVEYKTKGGRVIKRWKKIKMDAEEARSKLEMPGRIWLDQKYISFWNYPKSKSDFRKLITDLEKRFGMKIWNDPNWKVEILIKEKDGKTFDPKDLNWDIKYLPMEVVPMLIPVKEYNPVKNFDYELPGEAEIKRYEDYVNQMKKLKAEKNKNKGKHAGYNDLLDELTNDSPINLDDLYDNEDEDDLSKYNTD